MRDSQYDFATLGEVLEDDLSGLILSHTEGGSLLGSLLIDGLSNNLGLSKLFLLEQVLLLDVIKKRVPTHHLPRLHISTHLHRAFKFFHNLEIVEYHLRFPIRCLELVERTKAAEAFAIGINFADTLSAAVGNAVGDVTFEDLREGVLVV